MSALIARADGPLTAAATWGLVDSTSYLASELANTSLTSSFVESQTFAPGAIEIDGIAIRIAGRVATPSGTLTARLATGGVDVAGTEVTINIADIPYGVGNTTAGPQNGWIFLKFAAPVTLLTATDYTLGLKASGTSLVNVYRNGTAGNWSRMLRTTTTQAPTAGDTLHILGEWTAAGTKDDRVVTMDSESDTDYGDGSTTLASFSIGTGGTLTWGTDASTDYVLELSGLLDVCVGGVLNMGTAGVPCPRDSTMTLQFDCASDGDFGLRVYGTLNAYGQSRLDGVTNHFALLAADANGGATSLTTDRQLSARSGDTIAIASTSRTPTDAEEVVLSGDAGATSLACGATSNAHLGTLPTQAEVIALNRDVIIRSVSTMAMAYVLVDTMAGVVCEWVEFRYLGASTAGKQGLEIRTVTGSCAIRKCSFRNFDLKGVTIPAASGVTDADNFTVDDNVFSKVGHAATSDPAIGMLNVTTKGNWSISGNVIISDNTGQGFGIQLAAYGGEVIGNRISSGGGRGLWLSGESFITGTISDNVIHSMGVMGLAFGASVLGGRISNTTIWRCSNFGIDFASLRPMGLLFDGLTCFGNNNANVNLGGLVVNITFRDAVFAGDSTFATADGVRFSASGQAVGMRFEGCSFGEADGIFVAHSTADIRFVATSSDLADITFVNTVLGSTTPFNGDSFLRGPSVLRFQRKDGADGTHQTVFPSMGTRSRDTSVVRTGTQSEKLEPSGGAVKLETQGFLIPIEAGESRTVSCYVRKGSTYNGSAPRLRVRANPAVGINEATIATHGAGADTFALLTGTVGPADADGVIDVYVDCDGTAGQVNVADWSWVES